MRYSLQQYFQWLLSWLQLHRERLSVTNLSSENNLPTFQLNAPVVIRAKVKEVRNNVARNQRREDMTSRRSDNLYALITFQGQESWMQVTRIALWTKS